MGATKSSSLESRRICVNIKKEGGVRSYLNPGSPTVTF